MLILDTDIASAFAYSHLLTKELYLWQRSLKWKLLQQGLSLKG